MEKSFTKLITVVFVILISIPGLLLSQVEVTLFHETFNGLTTSNTTGNALTGGNTDETGYVVGGGGSTMICSEDGTMNLTGGRFATKNLDLSGNNVKLYVTYKLIGGTTKKFQIDIDKTGTSGMGGILNEAGSSSPTTFTTKVFAITGGTATSYIHFRTESAHTIVLDEIKITHEVASLTPLVELTSGVNPAPAMETLEMDPVVYTYTAVANDANVLYNWYTDNTYTTLTAAPAGLSIAKNTEAKTVTISGTPTIVGTYYYKISINEENGNAIEGSVVVDAYVTPAPEIELTSGNNNQQVKAGSPITNVVYSLTYADGAEVTGLPNGLTGVYNSGTYTISGTVNESVTPGTFTYTITADPLSGYSGSNVTIGGNIIVKSVTAKAILYLTADVTPSTQDTKLYPLLNENTNYVVTVKQASGLAPAISFYDSYDLVVLNEIVGGTNAEAVALKNINKPILNLKSFVYNSGRWGWGTADNGLANNGTVTVAQPTHPVFSGITLNGGTLDLLTGAAAKGIQPADASIGGITVATAPKSDSNHAIAIHDVPGNVRGETITAKYILIALANDSYDKMTNDALTLFNNAVSYLLTGSQFVPVYTTTENVSSGDIIFENMQIRNPNNEFIRVMDMSGRIIISSDKDINMSTFNKGIYIIRGKSGVMKIALTR
jgi:hypothetical protein